MFPFRELEIYDSFLLGNKQCEKVGDTKYLIYDESGEPESLNIAQPNMMVELIKDSGLFCYFFSTLVGMIDELEKAGEPITMKEFKKLAITSLKRAEE